MLNSNQRDRLLEIEFGGGIPELTCTNPRCHIYPTYLSTYDARLGENNVRQSEMYSLQKGY